MQRLATAFRDVNGLRARIGTFLSQSSVLRIGIVPVSGRNQAAPLLTALVDEPVQRTAWGDALARRPLTKDVLVTQSAEFRYTETQNSLAVYPLPFPGPAVEYLEANSVQDSYDHLKTCHLLLFVGENAQKLANVADPQFPWLKVATNGGSAEASEKSANFAGELVDVDANLALRANEQLRESARNVNEFVVLRRQSNIACLQNLSRPHVYAALRDSIFATCEQQIAELAAVDPKKIAVKASARQEWAHMAHHELQSAFLPALHRMLTHDFAFYKLYARSDDVEPTLEMLVGSALPQSRAQFQFLLGQASDAHHTDPALETMAQPNTLPLVSDLSRASLRAVLQALGVQLPIGAVALAGYALLDLSGYAMTALALLGAVAGLRQLQTQWLRASRRFTSRVSDVLVENIQQRERQLWERGEQQAHNADTQRAHLEAVLAEARAASKH